jgi:hypothetical protein
MTITATPNEVIALGDAILARLAQLERERNREHLPTIALLKRFQQRLANQVRARPREQR